MNHDHNANLERFQAAFRNARGLSMRHEAKRAILARSEAAGIAPPFTRHKLDALALALDTANEELEAAASEAISAGTFASASDLARFAATIS